MPIVAGKTKGVNKAEGWLRWKVGNTFARLERFSIMTNCGAEVNAGLALCLTTLLATCHGLQLQPLLTLLLPSPPFSFLPHTGP